VKDVISELSVLHLPLPCAETLIYESTKIGKNDNHSIYIHYSLPLQFGNTIFAELVPDKTNFFGEKASADFHGLFRLNIDSLNDRRRLFPNGFDLISVHF
jgi:hypothetical protein